MLIAVEHGVQLLLETAPLGFGMYHDVILADFAVVLEAEYLCMSIIQFYLYVHLMLILNS